MQEDYEELPEEVTQQYIEGFNHHIEQGMLSRKNLDHIYKMALRKIIATQDDGTPKQYLSYSEGMDAYSKILDTGVTAEEALQYVAICYGKDSEWVDEVKNKNYLHAKRVVEDHREHPIQKAMKKDGTLRTKALTSSKTPNHQLRELHSQRKLHTTIQELHSTDLKLREELDQLKAHSAITDSDVGMVREHLSLDGLTVKQKASTLKAKDIPQKKVAEYLSIPIRTLKRWWPDL